MSQPSEKMVSPTEWVYREEGWGEGWTRGSNSGESSY